MTYLLDGAERLALIRQQRAEAAKKREEEKAGNVLRSSFTGFDVFEDMYYFQLINIYSLVSAKEQKKAEARK